MTETTGAFTANAPQRFKLGTVGQARARHRGPHRRGRRDHHPQPGQHPRLPRNGPRPPPSCSTRTAGCTPATWAPSTRTASSTSSTARRRSSSPPGARTSRPANIEGHLKEHPLIGHALAYGDSKPYPVAILTLDAEVAPAGRRPTASSFTTLADLAEHPDVLKTVEGAIAVANEKLSRVQQVKRWRLLPVEWTAETDGAHPEAEAQAPRDPRQLRGDHRRHVRGLIARRVRGFGARPARELTPGPHEKPVARCVRERCVREPTHDPREGRV